MAAIPVFVRPPEENDLVSLTDLMNQLGYPTAPNELQARLNIIHQQPNYITLVACFNGRVCGLIGASLNYFYEYSGTYVRIASLVTHSDFRKMGIGNALIEAIEDWARKSGATSLVLNCGNRPEREAAHAFYRRQGFDVKSTGYVKKL